VTLDFFVRLGLHLLTLLIMTRCLFYPRYRNREFAFSYFMLGNMVFLMTFWLKDVTLSMGFAFGLFAIFSILRYRTETLPMSQMTFLFIGIGVGMLNAAILGSWQQLMALNLALLALLAFSLGAWFLPQEKQRVVLYDRTDNITPDKEADLIADLHQRTGLAIKRVEIESVDFLRETSVLRIYYR